MSPDSADCAYAIELQRLIDRGQLALAAAIDRARTAVRGAKHD